MNQTPIVDDHIQRATEAVPHPHTMPLVFKTHPILHQVAKDVPYTKSLTTILPFMLATLDRHPEAVGLAAPQIGIDARVIVIKMPDALPYVIVNPVIFKRRGDR